MADGFKPGGSAPNVKSYKTKAGGSKTGMYDENSEGIGKGKVAKVEKQHDATSEFAEGGTTKMFGHQAAEPQHGAKGTGSSTTGGTAHDTGADQSQGTGAKFAEGGKGKMFGYVPSIPAAAGITSAR